VTSGDDEKERPLHRTTPSPALRSRVTPAVVGSIALTLSVLPAPLAASAADVAPRPEREPATHPAPAAKSVVVGRPASSSAIRTHVVAHGDTVSAIAARHGLRTADVLAWNDLTWRSVIHPGDVLRLGAGAERSRARSTSAQAETPRAAGRHTVRDGDTLWAIAKRHGVSVSALAKANDLGSTTTIRPGQRLTIPGTAAMTRSAARTLTPAPASEARSARHEVAAGETLWAVADRHGVSLTRLLAANGLDRSSIIYPGQKLDIPSTAAVAATSRAEAADVVLDEEQIGNVRTIIEVGRSRGVSRDGIAVALSTAMVESWIRNLDWGDRDSLGLFQQRPSAGWGSEDQVRDTRRAAAAFFGGPQDPNGSDTRGLLDIDGWESMDFADAAQAVQISAYPKRYGIWEDQAYRWIDLYG